jgi:hypothetical protein
MYKFIIILLVIILSCGEKKEAKDNEESKNEKDAITQTEDTGMRMSNSKRITLLSEAITKGDTSAYNELATYHIFTGRGPEFLYHSIIMANKYDHARAYFVVYLILAQPLNYQTFDSLGERTKIIAYYYLLKASEKGDNNAFYTAQDIFGKNKVPKSSKYRDLK